MSKVKCFEKDEAMSYPGRYIIRPICDNFHLDHTEGSFAVIGARLFGISYASFLRMCRDCYGAELIGKNSKYPVAYFKQSKGLELLLEDLNTRANLVLWERELPEVDVRAMLAEREGTNVCNA